MLIKLKIIMTIIQTFTIIGSDKTCYLLARIEWSSVFITSFFAVFLLIFCASFWYIISTNKWSLIFFCEFCKMCVQKSKRSLITVGITSARRQTVGYFVLSKDWHFLKSQNIVSLKKYMWGTNAWKGQKSFFQTVLYLLFNSN